MIANPCTSPVVCILPLTCQVYISGHGGNEFMKFQDTAELMAQDVADAVAQMHQKGRYRELLLIVETCQAATLYSRMK